MRGNELFLDTNVFLRHLLGDDPVQSPKATAYFRALEQGRVRACISDIVVFEVVFTLERGYRRSKAEIQSVVLPLLALPNLVLPRKRALREVFRLYVEQNISFAEAYHAVLMRRLRLTTIVSFDRDFDRIETVTRVEPGATGEPA